MRTGLADICFMAIEPSREAEIAFSTPYAVVEGVFVVPRIRPSPRSPTSIAAMCEWGVKDSSHDLFLSRTLRHAQVVRGGRGVDVFREQGLEVAAGTRHLMAEYVVGNPGFGLLEGRFMQVKQAVGTTMTRAPGTLEFLRSVVEELKADGFVADAIRRADNPDVSVAPPG